MHLLKKKTEQKKNIERDREGHKTTGERRGHEVMASHKNNIPEYYLSFSLSLSLSEYIIL